jgi:hypothetical protein
MRACDESVVAGDNTKFRNCCGWTPKISITTTLRDILDWWRVQLAGVAPSASTQEAAQIRN